MRMVARSVTSSLLLLCIQLTLTVYASGSQANENIWTERLEHLHVVRCKAPYDVVSLTVFTGSGTALAAYHATPNGPVCKSTSTFSSCVYNKSIAMVSVIVMGLEEGETTVFRCDIYTFSSKGGQNDKSYFVNVTQERKTSSSTFTSATVSQTTTLQTVQPSISNSSTSSSYYDDLICQPVWNIDVFWKLFIASSVLMFIFAAISVVLGCLLRRCQEKLRKKGYYSIICDPLPQENNFRKKKEKTIEHMKATQLCTSSTVDLSSILSNNTIEYPLTPPPDCTPPVVPGSTLLMQYERSALERHPSVGRNDKDAVATSVYYQEPWDNLDKKLQEMSQKLFAKNIFHISDVTYNETTV